MRALKKSGVSAEITNLEWGACGKFKRRVGEAPILKNTLRDLNLIQKMLFLCKNCQIKYKKIIPKIILNHVRQIHLFFYRIALFFCNLLHSNFFRHFVSHPNKFGQRIFFHGFETVINAILKFHGTRNSP